MKRVRNQVSNGRQDCWSLVCHSLGASAGGVGKPTPVRLRWLMNKIQRILLTHQTFSASHDGITDF